MKTFEGKTTYKTIQVNGIDLFYREAGNAASPTVLLLHGFPTSSHMFRDLIPKLADKPFFLPAGAKAFTRHNPRAKVHFLDTGHFAL